MKTEQYLCEPGLAFCTGELKKASLKKSREPLKTTLALFLAWRPAISRVFFPTAWGYWNSKTLVAAFVVQGAVSDTATDHLDKSFLKIMLATGTNQATITALFLLISTAGIITVNSNKFFTFLNNLFPPDSHASNSTLLIIISNITEIVKMSD